MFVSMQQGRLPREDGEGRAGVARAGAGESLYLSVSPRHADIQGGHRGLCQHHRRVPRGQLCHGEDNRVHTLRVPAPPRPAGLPQRPRLHPAVHGRVGGPQHLCGQQGGHDDRPWLEEHQQHHQPQPRVPAAFPALQRGGENLPSGEKW